MTSPSLPRTVARRAVPLTAIAVGALAFAGCGGGSDSGDEKPATPAAAASTTTGAAPKAALADDVPARAAAFGEATFRPGQEPKAAIEQLSRLFGVEDPGAALIKELDFDDELEDGKTFEKDVLPALGDHVGAFLLQASSASAAKDPQAAFVAEVKDRDALRAALEPSLKKDSRVVTLDGQEVYRDKKQDLAAWFGDDVLAVGTVDAVRAVITTANGGGLDGNQRYKAAVAQVRATDPVGLAWVDLQQAPTINGAIAGAERASSSRPKAARPSALSDSQLESLPPSVRRRLKAAEKAAGGSSGSSDMFGASGALAGLDASSALPTTDATFAMALQARPGRLTVQAGGTAAKGLGADTKVGSDAVAALPAGSWLAFGSPVSGLSSTGTSPAETLAQLEPLIGKLPAGLKDGIGKIRSVSGAVRGDSLIGAGGAVVLQTQDAASAKALMDGLGEVLKTKTGLPVQSRTIDGADSGLVAAPQGVPLQIAAGVKGDRVAIGLGVDSVTAVFRPSSKLSDDAVYGQAKQALGGAAPSLIINPKPLTDLVSSLGVAEAREAVNVLRRLKLIAASQEATGATTFRGTFVVDYDASTPTP